MSYTFSATGLPPGLSLLGNTVSGTPTAPGSYTVTFTVSDGVSIVSEVVSVTIGVASVPMPFWQLLISADSGCYAGDSVRAQLTATAESGSYWRDSVFLVPSVAADSGSYWYDGVDVQGEGVITSTGDPVFTSAGDRVVASGAGDPVVTSTGDTVVTSTGDGVLAS